MTNPNLARSPRIRLKWQREMLADFESLCSPEAVLKLRQLFALIDESKSRDASCQLSDNELIAAAVAAGQVRRVPRGTSGLFPTPIPAKVDKARTVANRPSQVFDETRLRTLWNSGDLRSEEIAAELRVSVSTLARRAKRLKLPSRKSAEFRRGHHAIAVQRLQATFNEISPRDL